MAESRRLIPISANWVLRRIQEGKNVRLKNAQIEGDIDLDKLDLPTEPFARTGYQKDTIKLRTECKIISSLIKITNSDFNGTVNFSNCLFKADAWFNGATFSSDAGFWGTIFSGDAWFYGATFSSDAWFDGATFSRYARFNGATFTGYARFKGATFSGDAWFYGATFSSHAWFDGATFSSDAWFYGAIFNGYARFSDATFNGHAGFNGATFSSDAWFNGAIFNGNVEFSRSEIKDIYFYQKQDNSYVKIKGLIYLDFMNYNRFCVRWQILKGHLNYDGATYLSLVKNFRNLELFEDADACYYQYRKESQTKKDWYSQDNIWIDRLLLFHEKVIMPAFNRVQNFFDWLNKQPPILQMHRFNWSKLGDHVSWISCGYGLKVWPMVIWIAGSILFFALVYNAFGGVSNYPGNVSPIDNIYFSTFALAGRPPPGNLSAEGSWKYVVLGENLLGYMFLALFVVVLGRKVVR